MKIEIKVVFKVYFLIGVTIRDGLTRRKKKCEASWNVDLPF